MRETTRRQHEYQYNVEIIIGFGYQILVAKNVSQFEMASFESGASPPLRVRFSSKEKLATPLMAYRPPAPQGRPPPPAGRAPPARNMFPPPAPGGGRFNSPQSSPMRRGFSEGGPGLQRPQHTQERETQRATRQAVQQESYLKAGRSGMRRFSSTAMPHLHNHQDEDEDEDDDERVAVHKEILNLDDKIREMYMEVKGHVKSIKKLQRDTDKKYHINYDDDNRGPRRKACPEFDVDTLKANVRTQLDPLTQTITNIFHKEKKWFATPFEFDFPHSGSSSPNPTISLVVNDKRGDRTKYPFDATSRPAILPDEEGYHHNEKKTIKRSKTVRNKEELHMFTPYGDTVPLIFDTKLQCEAMKNTINLIIETCQQYKNDLQDFNNQPEADEKDPQEYADEAQCFEAYGAGLYDAVVGESASFEIRAKDPDNNDLSLEEMQCLVPSYEVFDEYGDSYWTEGHGGSSHRLNIQLFTMTEQEYKDGDYSR